MSLSDSATEPQYVGVADEVRAWLARRRITASAAAKKLGWQQAYISRRLTGLVPFDVADLLSLGDLLDVSPGEFFRAPAEPGTMAGVRKRSFWHRRSDVQFRAA